MSSTSLLLYNSYKTSILEFRVCVWHYALTKEQSSLTHQREGIQERAIHIRVNSQHWPLGYATQNNRRSLLQI